MKSISRLLNPSVVRRVRTGRIGPWFLGSVLLAAALSASAGSFFSDFNAGLPANTTNYGTAKVLSDQGYTNSGCLVLTTNASSQTGTFILTNCLDPNTPVVGFVARFKVYIGPVDGTGADGFSFNFCPDLTTNTGPILFGEEGQGTGLAVAFDTYANGNGDDAGIDVKFDGIPYGISPLAPSVLRTASWVDVTVMQHPDGYIAVAYDGTWVYTNTPTGLGVSAPMTNWYFALGARTGGAWDNHWIDNLSLETLTNGMAYVYYYSPIGRQARADAPLTVVLSDFYDPVSGRYSQVDPASITMTVDGVAVVPTMTQWGVQRTVTYVPPTLLASGSTHTVSLSYADLPAPVAYTNTWQWSFTVADYSVIPGPAPASLVSANPGFDLHINQSPVNAGNDLAHAEAQLAGLLIDSGTGLPYTNLATLSTYTEANVLNYSQAGALGSFPTELPSSIPGLPGWEGGTTNCVLDAITYLHLVPGVYTLGVNSSDGFRLLLSTTPDFWATTEMSYDRTHAPTDTMVTFGVTNAGYYPFRILYFNGGPEAPYPSTNTPSLEFFSVDATGTKTLINDSSVSGAIPAYRPAQTLPYVRSVSPLPNTEGVATSSAIDVVLVDGSITAQTSTLQLLVNSNAVTPQITAAGGVTTVHYQPSSAFAMDTTNWVQCAFTDSAGTRRTNVWKFTTERIMSWLWRIAPDIVPWVSSTGGTDRGLAFNPKTGHVLIVSRAAASPVNGLGVGIFDANTGAYLNKLNVSTILTDGVYTFSLNMIGVGEDGVIYACDLATSASHVFRIYRWQDENAVPTLAWSGNPTGGKTRWGDAFRVRGSGAGTRLMTGSDDPANTGNPSVPLFTTTDGTNFTLTLLSVAGGLAGGHRGGLAFDCTNSFYGCINGKPLQYVGYAGAPSTTASRIAQMNIYDINGTTTAYIAPIGLDIINRRLYGIGSGSAPSHNCSMFDLPLATSGPVTPRDAKTFPRAASTWATGNIDMTPDGTRVFGLDTGNGAIAFSVAPKLAAPAIWGQPRNFYAAPDSKLGYVDVEGVGAPQNYQWRFSGRNPADPALPLLNATSRTLDLYQLQQSQLGYYSVVITNSMGSVTSTLALVNIQLVITNQPVSLVVNQGSPASLSVGAYGGAEPVTYQWQLNNVAIPGANSSAYTIPAANYTDGAYLGYKCVITDAFTQTVTSASVTLNVLTPVAPPPGLGTGLLGAYYTNVNYGTAATPPNPFVGPPALTRVDAGVDIDWGTGSFDPADPTMPADYFQVRWTGQIEPLYSQNYLFFTTSDDGQRLWVNGVKLIDDWALHGPTERVSPSIALNAGQKYDIIYEFFERASGAVARLWWWSPSQLKEAVSYTQLYPVSFVEPTVVLTAPASGLLCTTNATVNLAATVTTNSGIVNKVQFYRGNTLIGEAPSAPYIYGWVHPVPGSHEVSARAVFNEASAAFSGTNTITVISPTPAAISGFTLSGTSGSLSGTGAVGQAFILLTATNLVAPVTWTPVETNSTGTGTFNFTLPTRSEGQSFYEVQSW